MKVYKVITGYNADFYGYPTIEKAEYFSNKEDAEKRYNEGVYYEETTQTTTTFKDGRTMITITDGKYYEERLKNAYPNEKVELIMYKQNDYILEEIEI